VLSHCGTPVAWNLFHVRDTSRRAVDEAHGLVGCSCGLKSTLRLVGRGDLTHRLGNLCHDVAAVPLEYGAVRRFPMRWEVAWGGEGGLPHGTVA
jgi:hypothetical protein